MNVSVLIPSDKKLPNSRWLWFALSTSEGVVLPAADSLHLEFWELLRGNKSQSSKKGWRCSKERRRKRGRERGKGREWWWDRSSPRHCSCLLWLWFIKWSWAKTNEDGDILTTKPELALRNPVLNQQEVVWKRTTSHFPSDLLCLLPGVGLEGIRVA